MSAAPLSAVTEAPHLADAARQSNRLVRWVLITITCLFLGAFVAWPTVNIFRQALGIEWTDLQGISSTVTALENGAVKYVRVFHAPAIDPNVKLSRKEQRLADREASKVAATHDAIVMTLCVLAVTLPLNVIFGIAAAWAITKFHFRGRTFLVTLIDLPFSVSPVVAGLIFVLLMGRGGLLGDWPTRIHWPWPPSAFWQGFGGHWFPLGFSDWREGVIFTPLATSLASIFVTFPFVARSLIPLMETQGAEQEQAALTLGASGRKMFLRVTLPQIKWGLLYGIILCTARAVGEFGAVSVVSGHLDANDTMPLRIEKLWQGYDNQGAFAVASVLASISIFTLLLKIVIDRRASQDRDPATERKTGPRTEVAK